MSTPAERWARRRPKSRPYTQIGIVRIPCTRCGEPALHQWNVCADGNVWRPLCLPCDVALNRLTLEWGRDPDWRAKIQAYALAQVRRHGATAHQCHRLSRTTRVSVKQLIAAIP